MDNAKRQIPISNVLEFSRLENRSRVFELRDQSLVDAMEEVRAVMDAQIEQEGFTLRLEIGKNLRFPFDREGLIRILISCVENSIKFGKDAERKEIAIRAESRNGRVLLEIAGWGPGAPRLALKSLFDDFFHVDDSLTRKTKGTGIGLALVRKLAEDMGGRVEAVNNSPGGLTIRMMFPGR